MRQIAKHYLPTRRANNPQSKIRAFDGRRACSDNSNTRVEIGVLSVSEPQIDEDAWSVNVRLEDASGQTVWEHVIYGIDEVQATLLGLHFAKTRLLDDGGYRFLGGTDLMLP